MTAPFSTFNKEDHFRPEMNWEELSQLEGAEFLWEVLEPISDMIDTSDVEAERSKRLSPSQKVLHFFWYLDDQVTNGGFILFYWNEYHFYLPTIIAGLELWGNQELLDIVQNAQKVYELNKSTFEKFLKSDDPEGLENALPEFRDLDEQYHEMGDEHYAKLEAFVRAHIDDFLVKK